MVKSKKDLLIGRGSSVIEIVIGAMMFATLIGRLTTWQWLMKAYSIVGIVLMAIAAAIIVLAVVMAKVSDLSYKESMLSGDLKKPDYVEIQLGSYVRLLRIVNVLLILYNWQARPSWAIPYLVYLVMVYLLSAFVSVWTRNSTEYTTKELYVLKSGQYRQYRDVVEEFKRIHDLLRLDGSWDSPEIKRERKILAQEYYDMVR